MSSAQVLAKQILSSHKRITLYNRQVSGVSDRAAALNNITQASNGFPAKRSEYGGAPGGSIALSTNMLSGMLKLAGTFTFRVTSVAGGSHSPNSNHYRGTAFDIDILGNQEVSASNPQYREFMAMARELGAGEVLGPGDAGHAEHIHVAWPN